MMGQSGCCEYECFGPCSCPVILFMGVILQNMGVKIILWNKDGETVNLKGF